MGEDCSSILVLVELDTTILKFLYLPPSYESLEVRGVSRLGIGDTTDTGSGLLVDIVMQPSSEYAGIGTYEVGEFIVARSGFGFGRGDKFEPVGLVTDYRLEAGRN